MACLRSSSCFWRRASRVRFSCISFFCRSWAIFSRFSSRFFFPARWTAFWSWLMEAWMRLALSGSACLAAFSRAICRRANPAAALTSEGRFARASRAYASMGASP